MSQNVFILQFRIMQNLAHISPVVVSFYKEVKLRITNNHKNTTKKQLYQVQQEKKVNKPGISKNLATCRIRICDLLQSNDFESHALSLESLKLKNQQTLVTNKAATYANKLKLKMISNLSIINIHQRKEIIMNAS